MSTFDTMLVLIGMMIAVAMAGLLISSNVVTMGAMAIAMAIVGFAITKGAPQPNVAEEPFRATASESGN